MRFQVCEARIRNYVGNSSIGLVYLQPGNDPGSYDGRAASFERVLSESVYGFQNRGTITANDPETCTLVNLS